MVTRNNPLLLALLTAGVLAGSAARAGAIGAQETADREGDQTGMSEEEVAAPVAAEAFQDDAVLGAHLYDKTILGILGKGNWGVEVVLLEPGGAVDHLCALHENKPLMPASTMKVFTGWFGYAETLELRAGGQEPAFPAPWRSYEAYAGHTLKVSDNDMAKAILKKFAPANGPSVLEGFYAKLGLAQNGEFKVVDGAGLATGNRATAHLEVSLLQYIHNSEHYKSYRELLAEPGQTGTLAGRLTNLNGSLYAKTGTLSRTRVAALTGFLEMGGTGTIIFSIIGNDASLSIDAQRARIDKVVETLHRDAVAANRPAAADATLVALRRKDIGGKLPGANFVFP